MSKTRFDEIQDRKERHEKLIALSREKGLSVPTASGLQYVDDLNTLQDEIERLRGTILRFWHNANISEGQAAQALGVERIDARLMLEAWRDEEGLQP